MEFEFPDAFGLFQVASPMRSDPPGTFYTEDGKKGRATYLPSDVRIAFDPAVPEGHMVMIDEASELLTDVARKGRKTGINLSNYYHQFPSLKRFAEQYTKFVPQENNNPKEKYTMDMSGIAKMRSDLEAMLAKFTSMVSIVERFGGEPGDGAVIKFEHTFEADFVRNEDPKTYEYVAIRRGGKWYVSGKPFGGRAIKWSELLEFIGDGRAWVAEVWRYVPVPGGAAAETVNADMVAAFQSVLANSSGRDTTEVAEELLKLVDESK